MDWIGLWGHFHLTTRLAVVVVVLLTTNYQMKLGMGEVQFRNKTEPSQSSAKSNRTGSSSSQTEANYSLVWCSWLERVKT